ncbi:hypothetical protein TNCV_4480581 [Trichonephila clavipes]|nr:hypothetical protein TNCV_4480581 [Trichonephila clavipes]
MQDERSSKRISAVSSGARDPMRINCITAHVGRGPMTVRRIYNPWFQDGNMERRAGFQRPLSLAAEKTAVWALSQESMAAATLDA